MTANRMSNCVPARFGRPAELVVEGSTYAIDLRRADHFWVRLKGLLGLRGLAPASALLLEPCYAIHTCFMSFSIDAVFLCRKGEVLAVYEHLAPYRAASHRRARYCLELAAGGAARLNIRPGITLEWKSCK